MGVKIFMIAELSGARMRMEDSIVKIFSDTVDSIRLFGMKHDDLGRITKNFKRFSSFFSFSDNLSPSNNTILRNSVKFYVIFAFF